MNHRNISIGAVDQLSAESHSIVGKAGNYQFKLIPYTKEIVRVQITKDPQFDDYPFSVILEPQAIEAKVQDSKNDLTLDTGAIKVSMEKNPLRFSFYSKDGTLINQDDPTLGSAGWEKK